MPKQVVKKKQPGKNSKKAAQKPGTAPAADKSAAKSAAAKSAAGKSPAKKQQSKKVGPGNFVFRTLKPSRKLGEGGVQRKTSQLGRLVRWPKYVKLQRQRKILLERLKIPPALNVFNQACGKPFAKELIGVFRRYKPESSKEKRDRLRGWAKLQAEGKPVPSEKKIFVKYGFNHVTNLIESGNAKLVLIAHDVDPIELVLWMPVLCQKKGIPFCIVKSKARLGTLVGKKSAACVALCDVNSEDKAQFELLRKKCTKRFNNNLAFMKRKWGNRTLGIKTRHKIATRAKRRKEEAERRRQAQEDKKKEKGKPTGTINPIQSVQTGRITVCIVRVTAIVVIIVMIVYYVWLTRHTTCKNKCCMQFCVLMFIFCKPPHTNKSKLYGLKCMN